MQSETRTVDETEKENACFVRRQGIAEPISDQNAMPFRWIKAGFHTLRIRFSFTHHIFTKLLWNMTDYLAKNVLFNNKKKNAGAAINSAKKGTKNAFSKWHYASIYCFITSGLCCVRLVSRLMRIDTRKKAADIERFRATWSKRATAAGHRYGEASRIDPVK